MLAQYTTNQVVQQYLHNRGFFFAHLVSCNRQVQMVALEMVEKCAVDVAFNLTVNG